MRTRAPGAELTTVKLDPASGIPLGRQPSEEVRQAIVSGTIVAGTGLPASRLLTKGVGVSRNTVLAAFHQLIADGYLLTKPGSGVYVCRASLSAVVAGTGCRRWLGGLGARSSRAPG